MKRTLQDIANCLTGEVVHNNLVATPLWEDLGNNCLVSVIAEKGWEDTPVTSASHNSAEATPGSLFFCFKGETSDGHLYAEDAAGRGATAIIAERDPFELQRLENKQFPPVFIVNNSLHALWRIALMQRNATKAKVIGITGSAGKTSVKEVLAHIFSAKGVTEKNQRNFNTQIGLSISMINASEEADFWIMEVGISHAHDMDELGSLLQPNVSIILNADTGHAEGLGELGVAAHKMKLGLYTAQGGTTYINADYPKLMAAMGSMKKELMDKKITITAFSTKAPSKWKGSFLSSDGQTGHFNVRMEGDNVTFDAPFVGSYGAENLAAIVAVCSELGIDTTAIQEGLSTAVLPEGRFTRHEFGSTTLVDDSYNSNPLSATRMVESVGIVAEKSQRGLILVLGEMKELGGEAAALHKALGRSVAATKPKAVFWKGNHFDTLTEGLKEKGFDGLCVQAQTVEDFSSQINADLLANAVVLVKGSRSNYLEKFVTVIRNLVQGSHRAV